MILGIKTIGGKPMVIFGGILVFLSLPLIIGYFVGEKKNNSWRNLGAIMLVIGILIMLIPS
jgi:drug/metabolite transporter superfamily protein YnfA